MKLLKSFWPVLTIFFLWFVFSSPFFLKGLVPFPSDYLVNNFAPWSAYPGFAGPVKNAATPDVIGQIYPWKNLVIEVWKSGNIPLWNPYSFAGTPLLANYQSAALSPLNLLYFILPFINAWSLQVLLAPLLAGLFTYIYLRSLKISESGAVVGSIAFMFCGFLTTWMVYGTLPYAILFLPLALFAIEKYYESGKWYFLVLLSLTIPLSFYSGHFQISLYFLLFVLAYVIYKFIQTKNFSLFTFHFSSIIAGLLLCAPQLLPSVEFYSHAVRSSTFLKTEVIPWGYLPTFIAPDIFGNAVTRNDWFGHYAEWNAYVGLLPLILGFYAFRKINQKVIFFAAAAVISILLAFQTPIIDILISLKIPVLSTSAASRVIVIFSFAVSVLAAIGFDYFLEDVRERTFKGIAILLGIFLFIFISLGLVVFLHIGIPADKSAIAISNLKLPAVIFFVFLVASLIVSYIKGWRAVVIITVVVIFLVAADMLRFSSKWMPFQPREKMYPDVPISKLLKQISGYDRVFGNFGAETSVTYRIPSIEGYDPLYIQRFGELIKSSQDGLYHTPERSGIVLTKNVNYAGTTVNLLGVKYFVHKKADDRRPWAFPIWEYPIDQFGIVYEDESYQVFENKKVFPRVFVVGKIITTSDSRQILKEIYDDKNDLKSVAILEEKGMENSEATGSARIISYSPNVVKIEAESNKPGLLVFTDPYYPGWVARVNGSTTKIHRADYVFRAIKIPEGKSSVEFIYKPASFRNGLNLAVVGLIGLICISFYAANRKSAR